MLLMVAKSKLATRIGALGYLSLGNGFYAYVGSAFGPGGLYARLRHHCFSRAVPRWHIDYLRGQVDIAEICFTDSPLRLECRWAAILGGIPRGHIPLAGFGASDCHCKSHLFHFPGRPALTAFRGSGLQRLMKKQFTVFKDEP